MKFAISDSPHIEARITSIYDQQGIASISINGLCLKTAEIERRAIEQFELYGRTKESNSPVIVQIRILSGYIKTSDQEIDIICEINHLGHGKEFYSRLKMTQKELINQIFNLNEL